jgi:transcriptional regulator with XRE-family HTH domain
MPLLKHTGDNKSSILKAIPGNMLLMSIAERIREAMDHAKLKAVDLAKACGVSESAVSQWLAGTTKPSAENIFAIADCTGYNPRWLAIEAGIRRGIVSVISKGNPDRDNPINSDFLLAAFEAVEEAEKRNQKVYPPIEKARRVEVVYRVIHANDGLPGPGIIESILKL